MRVAVTGVGGFIGANVASRFAELGFEVFAHVGPPGDARRAPATIARSVYAELADRDALVALFAGADVVVHLAGPPSVRDSFDDPQGYARAHTEGTAAVLAACRTASVGRIVYVSSAEVYGRPQTDPVAESHRVEARSPYAAAKIGAEQLVRAFGFGFGIAATIVRPFSVYGPGMGAHALIPAIGRQLGTGGPIRLNDLRPERDYCFIDDVSQAIVLAAQSTATDVAAVNVGSGTGVSVLELARAIVRLHASDRDVVENEGARRPGNAEILRLVADRTFARERLGWEPAVALEDGLARTLHAFVAP